MVAIAAHARVLEHENGELRARVAQLEAAARDVVDEVTSEGEPRNFSDFGRAVDALRAVLAGD